MLDSYPTGYTSLGRLTGPEGEVGGDTKATYDPSPQWAAVCLKDTVEIRHSHAASNSKFTGTIRGNIDYSIEWKKGNILEPSTKTDFCNNCYACYLRERAYLASSNSYYLAVSDTVKAQLNTLCSVQVRSQCISYLSNPSHGGVSYNYSDMATKATTW